jgi:protein-S-isoprenylcysteine O-methyltransferase Ste14
VEAEQAVLIPAEPFHAILVAAALVLFPVALYHRIRSQATREPLDRRKEGLFLLLTLRPIGLLGALGFLAYLVRPSWMDWSAIPVPAALRWAGIAVGVLGAALWIWTFRTLGPNLTDTVVTRRNHTLVTGGAYRWVRHPFYVAVALTILANSLAAANWFLFLCGAATMGLIALRTRREEALLVERFGDAYREYMLRTGRFFPRATAKGRHP